MNKLNLYIVLLLCIVFYKKIQTIPIDCPPDNPFCSNNLEIEPEKADKNKGYDTQGSNLTDGYNNSPETSGPVININDNDGFNNAGSNDPNGVGDITYQNQNLENVDNKSIENNKSQSNLNTDKKDTEKNIENNVNRTPKKSQSNGKYNGYLIFLSVVVVIIILLTVGIVVYKRKYLVPPKEMRNALGNEMTPECFMDKLKVINLENPNNSPLLNFNMANAMNTSFSNSSLDKNSYGFSQASEDYSRKFDSMNRGLKPPPARDNNNKKKNIIKIKNSSPLVVTTKRKSKNNDLSSNASSINRTSTEMSLANRISHCSSNGGFGYINNKLNKHSSVAMTFGCHAISDKEEESIDSPNTTSPTHTSIQTNNPNTSSRASRISSQKSLTSFISFKNRISSYISGGKRSTHSSSKKDSDSERVSYNTDESSSRFTFYSKNKNYISGSDFGDLSNSNRISSKRSINIDTSIIQNNTKDATNTPINTAATNESCENLINNNFFKDSGKELDLTLNVGK